MKFTNERNDALNFLQEHPLGTLATINSDGLPQLCATYFFTEKDFTCYFVTKNETRKCKNIIANPKSVLFSYAEDELVSVEVVGNAEVVVDAALIADIIGKFGNFVLHRKAGYWIPPISQLDAGQYVVCKLIPTDINFNGYINDLESAALPWRVSFQP